jgi:HEAT repeat protein
MEKRSSSGLGRSIDELFQSLSTSSEGGAPSDGSTEPRPAPDAAEAGEGEEARIDRSHRFAELVAEYLDGAPDERDRLAPEILEVGGDLQVAQELDVLADGVVSLTLAGAGGHDEEAMALAREIMDPGVAMRIANQLGEDRDEEAREALKDVIRAHSTLLLPALTEALAEAPDRSVRRAVMDALPEMPDLGREVALRLLEDDRWFALRNGVVLLGELGGEDAVQALTVPLGHEDPRVRRDTVTALSKLGGENAGLLLLGMLEDGAPEVRATAATGVGLLRVTRAQRPLEQMLDREDSEDVLVPVIRALGQLGDPGPVPALEKRATGSLFSRPPRDVRIAAYRALAAIGTPHARSVVRNGAGDKDPEIQNAVGMILRQVASEREQKAERDQEAEAGEGAASPEPPGEPGPEENQL